MQLSTEITRRKKQTHQLLAELDGSILVALLLPLAASAEDADPPEPGRGHRRHLHHLRCFSLFDLHVLFCVHLPLVPVLAPCLCSPLCRLQQWWHSRMGRYPTTAWLALLHSIAPPLHFAVIYILARGGGPRRSLLSAETYPGSWCVILLPNWRKLES